jgi:diguanylate cyclase
MNPDLSWKEKYLQELNAAEQRDQQWQQQRLSLERMLVRTSIALKGQTEDLDHILDNIRDDIRNKSLNEEHWQLLRQKIDQQMLLLDQRKSASEANEPASPDPGLDEERLHIARYIGTLLEQLLNDLPLSVDVEKKGRDLQKVLLHNNDWEDLRLGLRELTELVMMEISRYRVQFDDFIQQLDQRLAVLRESLSAHTSAQTGRLSATDTLSNDLQGGLDHLGEHIRGSTNLGQLKQSVSLHLSDIFNSVNTFRERESEREKTLADQLETMQQKILTMETESELMHEQVLKERKRANTDMLTQLPNRDAWQERLQFELERWQRYESNLTIAVVDIDFFKRVNDSYGHKAGDRVLQLLARELKKGLRSTDFIARVGGEEFVVLLPETTGDQAKKVLDSLRERVAKLPFHFSNQQVVITFSAGLTSLRRGDTDETLFERADRTLYLAKKAGRNLVMISKE